MDDETRKRIEKYRIGRVASVVDRRLPTGVMAFVRQAATPQLVQAMLKKYDDGEIDAVDFVELIRQWLKGA